MAWSEEAKNMLGTEVLNLFDALEENDINVRSIDEETEGEITIEMQFYSDAGEDFNFTVTAEKTGGNLTEDFSKALREYGNDFDAIEHAKIMDGARNAPDLDELIEDAKEIKQFLLDTADRLIGLEPEKKQTVEFELSQEQLEGLVKIGLLNKEYTNDDIVEALTSLVDNSTGITNEREYEELKDELSDFITKVIEEETYGTMCTTITASSYDEVLSADDLLEMYRGYQKEWYNDKYAYKDTDNVEDAESFGRYIEIEMHDRYSDYTYKCEMDIVSKIEEEMPEHLKGAYQHFKENVVSYELEIIESNGYKGADVDVRSFLNTDYNFDVQFATEQEKNSMNTSVSSTHVENLDDLNKNFLKSEEFEKEQDNAVTYLIHQQGHTLAEVYKEEYGSKKDISDEERKASFVKSFAHELKESESTPYNQSEVTALISLRGEQVIEFLDTVAKAHNENAKNQFLEFSQETQFGIHDRERDLTTKFETALEKPAVFPVSMVENVQFEIERRNQDAITMNKGYEVGFTDSCYEKGAVSFTDKAPELVKEDVKEACNYVRKQYDKEHSKNKDTIAKD